MLKNLLYCCIVIALFSSCVEEVSLDNETEKKIVVNCMLQMKPVQKLKLSYSNPLGKFYYEEVTEAKVSLFADGVIVGNFKKAGFNEWEIDFEPKVGQLYQLQVEVAGEPLITATTQMPEQLTIKEKREGDLDIRKHFEQQKAECPYWMFVITHNKDIITTPVVSQDDKLAENIGTNHPYSDHFNISEEGMKPIVGAEASTQAYLAYIRIDTPPDIDDSPISFYVEGRLNKSMVFFRSSSEEYDRYMKTSIQKMMSYEVEDDPAQWFDENSIYSNIENGIGIFAAFSATVVVFDAFD